ncbi:MULTISPECIES: hypothetical protein [Sphingomonadales]|jgi:hypothetical protein|uniref:Uncharacterized protein n=2 Tax=Sphingobium TaxID=165695 RepID=A0A0S3F134_9SPHN|nr:MULTISPECIES: hypothetical protein [Sphingomonadaceae]ALR21389.1 hypothetical protein ATN00_14910 [Sphingobium baderi]ARR56456.1 hypothetical protein HY78_24925 [Rhizorhabdus wittichii DC-6]AMK18081.1 hypothetical protein K663_08500 [Sphingobium sp. MI1205]QUT05375.1 hypothetical protein KFK14_20735 [Sphingobium phenoxybenzoativorans]UZW56125.1 hypothetical protein NUH86_04880 [Sphingobium sp. JS3065]
MARKKLSLRLPGKGSSDGDAANSEEIAAALALIETHGQRAGQALVDEAQAAIKARDDHRVLFLERVRVALLTIEPSSSAMRPQ